MTHYVQDPFTTPTALTTAENAPGGSSVAGSAGGLGLHKNHMQLGLTVRFRVCAGRPGREGGILNHKPELWLGFASISGGLWVVISCPVTSLCLQTPWASPAKRGFRSMPVVLTSR